MSIKINCIDACYNLIYVSILAEQDMEHLCLCTGERWLMSACLHVDTCLQLGMY